MPSELGITDRGGGTSEKELGNQGTTKVIWKFWPATDSNGGKRRKRKTMSF